jgi:predicted  nucleic acid-binding Zn-ribbon protein
MATKRELNFSASEPVHDLQDDHVTKISITTPDEPGPLHSQSAPAEPNHHGMPLSLSPGPDSEADNNTDSSVFVTNLQKQFDAMDTKGRGLVSMDEFLDYMLLHEDADTDYPGPDHDDDESDDNGDNTRFDTNTNCKSAAQHCQVNEHATEHNDNDSNDADINSGVCRDGNDSHTVTTSYKQSDSKVLDEQRRSEYEQVFRSIDTDGDGVIELESFVMAACRAEAADDLNISQSWSPVRRYSSRKRAGAGPGGNITTPAARLSTGPGADSSEPFMTPMASSTPNHADAVNEFLAGFSSASPKHAHSRHISTNSTGRFEFDGSTPPGADMSAPVAADELAKLREKVRILSGQLRNAQNKYDILEEMHRNSELEIEQLTSTLGSIKERFAKSREHANRLEANSQHNANEIRDLKVSLEDSQSRNSQLHDKLDRLEESLSHEQEASHTANEVIAAREALCKSLEQKIGTISLKLQETQQQLERASQEPSREVYIPRDEYDDIAEQLHEAADHNAELQHQLESMKSLQQQKQQHISMLQKKVSTQAIVVAAHEQSTVSQLAEVNRSMQRSLKDELTEASRWEDDADDSDDSDDSTSVQSPIRRSNHVHHTPASSFATPAASPGTFVPDDDDSSSSMDYGAPPAAMPILCPTSQSQYDEWRRRGLCASASIACRGFWSVLFFPLVLLWLLVGSCVFASGGSGSSKVLSPRPEPEITPLSKFVRSRPSARAADMNV